MCAQIHLMVNLSTTTRPSKSTSLIYTSWPTGSRIAESKQSLLSEVSMTLLCFGTSVVEGTPDQCQDSGITLHLLQKTQDSFVQTSPRPPHSIKSSDQRA